MKRQAPLILVLGLLSYSGAQEQKLSNECHGNLQAESESTRDAITSFWAEFATAVRHNQRAKVAAMINYPVNVSTSSGASSIGSAKEFLTQYDKIFSDDLKRFLNARGSECINRVGAQGFSLGSGQIWMDQVSGSKVKIIAINAIVYAGEK